MSAVDWRPGRLLQKEMDKSSELRASVAKITAEKGSDAQSAVDQMEAALQERFDKNVSEYRRWLTGKNRDNPVTMRREFVAADGDVLESLDMAMLCIPGAQQSAAPEGVWIDISSRWGVYT